MRKIDFEPKHIKELNRELDYERKGKLIFKTVSTLILTIMVIGPTVLLLVLNADWIDQFMGKWQVQFCLGISIILFCSYLYIRWKLKN